MTEFVWGDDLRSGDVVLEGVAATGSEDNDHVGRWGLRGATVEVRNGVRGHSLHQAWSPDNRFHGRRLFKVKSPRPHPEVNEFGPVCP